MLQKESDKPVVPTASDPVTVLRSQSFVQQAQKQWKTHVRFSFRLCFQLAPLCRWCFYRCIFIAIT